MNQYLITAYDFTDSEALPRRMNARPSHLEDAKALKAAGNLIVAGAILNDEGKMIGSTLIMQFETDEALEAWKLTEPYMTMQVWEAVDIKPFKVAPL